jgi:hypothetical protein
MRPLAHHAGEQTLTPLLLLASAWLPLLMALTRTRLAATRARLTSKAPAAAGRDAGQDGHEDISDSPGSPRPLRRRNEHRTAELAGISQPSIKTGPQPRRRLLLAPGIVAGTGLWATRSQGRWPTRVVGR